MEIFTIFALTGFVFFYEIRLFGLVAMAEFP